MTEKLDFKISTGLKDIIGKELITEAHTAVFELVKNAYDANASQVDIVFQNVKSANASNPGKILIADDGDGMSYDDIKNKWLFVGYSKKKEHDADKGNFRDRAASKNRVMAGAKGIGRFSADRLGGKLNLYTKTRSNSSVYHISMDWGWFESNQDEEFQNIKVECDILDMLPDVGTRKLPHGTILEILPLADKWDKEKLVKLKKYLQRLVNPAQISAGERFKIHIVADEFLEQDRELKKKNKDHEVINGKVSNIVFEKMGIRTTQITCNIMKTKITTQIIDKGRFVFKTEEGNPFLQHLYDINVTLFYLNKEAKRAFTRIMGMQPIKFGSVFLYKSGFRIHPYGEEKDDWLGLELRKGQGYARHLSMRELIGRVEINRTQRGFSEVSSRHGGVVETEEYRRLLEFMQTRVIRWLERYVVEGLDWDRPKEKAKKSDEDLKKSSLEVLAKFTNQIKDPSKRISFNPDLMSILEEKLTSDLPEVMKNLRTMASFAGSDAEKIHMKRDLERLETIAREHASAATTAAKALMDKEKEILFLRESQPTDAKLAADYNHWISISTGHIAGYLQRLVDAIRGKHDADSLMAIVESISRENQRISMAASIISKATFDVQTTTKTADIVAYVVQYITNVASEGAERMHFSFHNRDAIFEMKFIPFEISMMVDNFIGNSRKAGAANVSMRFSVEGRTLRILVSDDGKGVPEKDKEHIFQRGFTTTIGTGIGLNHVQSMAQNMDGAVRFLDNNVSGLHKGACFEVIFNAGG